MCTLNDILTQLRIVQQSTSRQIGVLDEIMDKSNNVLLQIETHSTVPPQEIPDLKPFSYDKETEQSIAKVIELYQHLPQISLDEGEDFKNDLGFSEYLHKNCQTLHYLSSNVRKLLVVGETMNKVTGKNQQNTSNTGV